MNASKSKFTWFHFCVDDEDDLDPLNDFLSRHRVIDLERKWVARNQKTWLVVLVETWDSVPLPKGRSDKKSQDARKGLTEAQGTVFDRLRDFRRDRSKEQGVPAYTLFTNNQLRCIVEGEMVELKQLAEVPGLGKARLERYGQEIVDICRDVFSSGDVLLPSEDLSSENLQTAKRPQTGKRSQTANTTQTGVPKPIEDENP